MKRVKKEKASGVSSPKNRYA